MWTEETQAEVQCNLVEEVGGRYLCRCVIGQPPDLVFNVKGRIKEWSRRKRYMTPVSIEICKYKERLTVVLHSSLWSDGLSQI